MDTKEASFADQVPQSLRIKLRDQVVTNAPDPALVEALAKRNERPHIKQEEDQNEGQKVFHPGAAKVEEAVTLTTEVLGEMQTGALSVADKEALGAKVLRQLDMEHYKECLKRSYLDGPGASIMQAQASIEKAREQNLAQQARGQKMAADLHLIPEPRSFLDGSSQIGIRAECLRSWVWDGWCDGHWPWGGDHWVQGGGLANTTQYWHAEVDAAAAGPLYAKLGYSAAAIEAMDLNPFGGHVNLTAQGAKLLGEEPAHSGHPNPGARQSGHSPAPFITIEGDDGKDYDAERKPPITLNNVVPACGKDYMRKIPWR